MSQITHNLTRLFVITTLFRVPDGEALHHLAQVRFTTQEEFMVIAVEIGSCSNSVEAPARNLTGKGAKSAMTAHMIESYGVVRYCE